LTLDGKLRRVEFDELVSAVKGRVKFSQTQLDAIKRIHDDGNLIAHFVSRRDKELLRVSKEIGRLSKRLSDKGVSIKDQLKDYNKITKKVRMWVNEADVLEDLRETASILLTLFSAVVFNDTL